jgi:selenocysteine lyase/cysteine desulfurase
VFGLVLPVQELGEMAHSHGIYFLVDAAQSAGVLPIDLEKMKIDFLCTAGHKGLFDRWEPA